jgi:hypothetical protein
LCFVGLGEPELAAPGCIASVGLPLPVVGCFIAIADHRSMSAV